MEVIAAYFPIYKSPLPMRLEMATRWWGKGLVGIIFQKFQVLNLFLTFIWETLSVPVLMLL